MKPYRKVPICDCGEPLVAIPKDKFCFFAPHVYVDLGAPYGKATPWLLRYGVLQALERAQKELNGVRPGWKFMIFDAYRPNAVQAFMVEREFATQATLTGLDYHKLTPEERDSLAPKVFRIFGVPSEDPATPPPHSTGAAIDLTLANEQGHEVDMGSPIDENSDRSNPDYFANATDESEKAAHKNRALLNHLMQAQGFNRHQAEWWHFSKGDQIWAYLENLKNQAFDPAHPHFDPIAMYGRATFSS